MNQCKNHEYFFHLDKCISKQGIIMLNLAEIANGY